MQHNRRYEWLSTITAGPFLEQGGGHISHAICGVTLAEMTERRVSVGTGSPNYIRIDVNILLHSTVVDC